MQKNQSREKVGLADGYDYNKECDFEVILNFLEHTTCVIRQLYWSKHVQRDLNYHGEIKTKD